MLDPHVSTSAGTRNHAFLVYDTLFGIDADQQPQPQMVSAAEEDANRLGWTLRLRDGLKWHDDERVLARDCIASIRRWAALDMFGRELLAATDELTAPDDRTIRFRLRSPFPLLPAALGKSQGAAPMMMPERLAALPPNRPVTEIVGSGPFRFRADAYVPGSSAVYERFVGYIPREGGVASGTAGPKRVHVDRVEWQVVPDVSTALSSLQTGRADWMDLLLPDLLPIAQRDRNIVTRVLEPLGLIGVARLNHLIPPFDNPAIRRALLGAVDQSDLMQSLVGDRADLQHVPCGVFCPSTAMASDDGLDVFTAKRDYDAVRKALGAAGYGGERVVFLMAADLPQYRAICETLADQMQRGGFNVDLQAMDWNTVVQRRSKREPIAQGGWNCFVTNGWYGTDMLDPVTHVSLRGQGRQGWAGWPDSPVIEDLRRRWMATSDLTDRKAIAVALQRQALSDVPYIPLGQNFPLTAFRREITDILPGFPTFWNLRRNT